MTPARDRPATERAAREQRRMAARVERHRHRYLAEYAEPPEMSRPTVLQNVITVNIIAHITLPREVQEALLREPPAPPSSKPRH